MTTLRLEKEISITEGFDYIERKYTKTRETIKSFVIRCDSQNEFESEKVQKMLDEIDNNVDTSGCPTQEYDVDGTYYYEDTYEGSFGDKKKYLKHIK